MAKIQLPTTLDDRGEEHSPHLRLASFIVSIGAITAAAAAFRFDGPNYLLIPSCIIAAWDLFYLIRSATVQPKTAAKMDAFACVIAIGFAIVYCIIVFGNVGFPCEPGVDQHWCSDMTKDSAAEGSATLLLFPLSLAHLILFVRDIKASEHTQGGYFNGLPR